MGVKWHMMYLVRIHSHGPFKLYPTWFGFYKFYKDIGFIKCLCKSNGPEVSRCVICERFLTVEHILNECGDFAEGRQFMITIPRNQWHKHI